MDTGSNNAAEKGAHPLRPSRPSTPNAASPGENGLFRYAPEPLLPENDRILILKSGYEWFPFTPPMTRARLKRESGNSSLCIIPTNWG